MRSSRTPKLLNWIELSESALRHNVQSLSRLARGRPLAVSVKSNAYGHGLAQIVSLLLPLPEVSWVSVHSVDEAIQCRFAGWNRAILLLGPTAPHEIDTLFEHDLEPTIFDATTLDVIGRMASVRRQPLRTHLKLETGTNRQGITPRELPKFVSLYKKYPSLGGLYGASTHFANIEDTTNHDYARMQLRRFRDLVSRLKESGLKPRLLHTASSAATILFEKTRFSFVRPGIAVYGHWPSKETYLTHKLMGGESDLFAPVLTWKSRVTQIKDVPTGEFISYGCTFRTGAPSRIAVLPVGYYDGYARSLSNRAHVLIRGERAPVRGRVCMNLMMVDVTHIRGVKLHDIATLIGADRDEVVSAEMLGEWSGSINYETLGRLNSATPRLVVG